MPFLVAFIPVIAAAAGAVGVTLAAITIASAVASAALAAQAARKAKNKARDAYNASLQDRTTMVRGTIEGRDLVLGRVRKSGQLAYIASSGATRNKLTMVVAVAGHEIDAFEKVFFNDIEVALDGSGNAQTAPYQTSVAREGAQVIIAAGSGSQAFTLPANYTPGTVRAVLNNNTDVGNVEVPTGSISIVGLTATVTSASIVPGVAVHLTWQYPEFSSWATVRFYTGSDSQAADALMIASLPGIWTANHRLRGVAYAVVELYYNDDVYTSGIPNISFQVRGARCFDPRTGTTVWTENPALHMRYLALSPLAGKLTAAQINEASIIAAANVCDTSAAFVVSRNGSNVTENRAQFRAGFVFRSGTRPKDGLDDLAQAMAGKWLYANNRLSIKAGAYTSPVMTLTDDDFSGVGDVTVQPGSPREDMVNIVTATMVDDSADYKLVDMPAVRADAYITADGAELPLEMQLDAVSYVPQAQYIARIVMRDARQALTVVASFKMRAYPIEVLDTVAITSSRYGWSAKTFEVLSRKWTLDGMIELTLKETAAAIFTLDPQFESVDIAPNTNLPTPWVVPAITGLAATNTTNIADGVPQPRVTLTWNLSTSEAVLQGGSIEVAYFRFDGLTNSTGDWPSERVSGRATSYSLTGLQEGIVYLFKVRAFNGVARSPWSSLVSLRVAQQSIDYGNVANRPQDRSNLLSNGGFEYGLDGWIGDLTGFFVGDAVWGRSVQRAGSISGTGTMSSAPFPVQVGDWYTLTGDTLLFATSGSTYLDLQFFNASNTLVLDGGQAQIAATHDFENGDARRAAHAVESQAPAGATYARARFVWQSVVGGTNLGVRQVKAERGRLPASAYSSEAALAAAFGAAATAQAAANVANAAIANIASDSILSAVEKPAVVRDYNVIISEQAGIDALATAYSVVTEKTAYDNAIAALTAYLGSAPLVGWNVVPGTDVAIVGATFRANFAAVYTAKQALLNRISDIANAKLTTRPNLLPNSGFEAGLKGWTVFMPSGPNLIVVSENVWGRIASAGVVPDGTGFMSSAKFPVQAGATYCITGDSALFAATGFSYFDLLYFNASDVVIADSGENVIGVPHDFSATDSNRRAHATQSTAPAGAVTACARYVWTGTGITAVGCRQIKVERGSLPATPYTADTSNSNIVTEQIAVGAVTDFFTVDLASAAVSNASGNATVATFSFTPDVAGRLVVSITLNGYVTAGKGGFVVSFNQGGVVLGQVQGTTSTVEQAVAVQGSFAVAAGVAVTCGLRINGPNVAGSFTYANDISVVGQFVKR